MVAKGFSQTPVIDFQETFSPTPTAALIRLLVATVVMLDQELFHLDAEQAYVQSKLNEDIYMKLPPGCGASSNSVVLLNKSLYGLKQASRSWNELLVSKRRKYGLEQCQVDPCIFRLRDHKGKVEIMMAIHVDDMVVAGKKDDCDKLRKYLNEAFPLNDLGNLNHYVGCTFERNRDSGDMTISQRGCIERLMVKFDIETSSPIPACPTVELRPRQEGEEESREAFREAVGGLMWLANMSRPDIANAVREVARYSHDPSKRHWTAVVKVLKYLHATKDLGLRYSKDGDPTLSAYADTTHASSNENRRSVSGGAVIYAGAAIAWFSRIQRCVTLSSTEAEYVSLADCVKEILFLRQVLQFLRPDAQTMGIVVYEDNDGAIQLAKNPASSGRTKHIDGRHHFLGDICREGKVRIEHVNSSKQRADFLTKPLREEIFVEHRDFLLNLK